MMSALARLAAFNNKGWDEKELEEDGGLPPIRRRTPSEISLVALANNSLMELVDEVPEEEPEEVLAKAKTKNGREKLRAAARLGPQPAGVVTMTFELAAERFGRLPRHYVECLEDRAIAIADQRAMRAKTPCAVHTLPASHSPFYSMPERLVEVLLQTAE